MHEMPNTEIMNLIVATLVMVATQFAVFVMLTKFRYNEKKTRLFSICFAAVLIIVCISGCLISQSFREGEYTFVTLTLPSVIYFFIVSKYRGMKFLVTYCISDVSIACMDLIAYILVLQLFDGDFVIDMLCRSVAMIAWMFCMIKLLRNKYQKALEHLQKGWGVMLIITVSMYALMVVLATYPEPIRNRKEDIPAAVLILIVVELMIIVIVRLIYNSMELKQKAEREKAFDMQLLLAEQHYNVLKDNMEEIRNMKHDLKHHFLIISAMAEQGKVQELSEYLSETMPVDALEIPVYSSNYMTNILISYYKDKSIKENIAFSYEGNLPTELPIKKPELATILCNMWQNAWEACVGLPAGTERYIRTKIQMNDNKLFFQCVNSCDGTQIRKNKQGELCSCKGENRGQGLKSVRYLVEQYYGYCNSEWDEREFVIQIVLTF